ncbi:DNA glycosylase AlkZ-like family protein [Microlunatus ginsengisoli]|uniref:Crosslink repair DNA glycosylase YcaQ family protein n=1 Tax=Microlunatus ginsengisoli TaxID=363863 RepID=A0ABP7AJI0_9ACTN
MPELSRDQVVAGRIHAQQLDRPPPAGSEPERAPTDAAVFDLGVQETGRDGASWALVNRGVPLESPAALYRCPDVSLAWTLRGAPHFYRRSELVDVLTATSPFSDADAAKRVIGASGPWSEAGISARDALAAVAAELRAVVDRPRVKGEVSTLVSDRLGGPYVRDCRRCDAVHVWELPFRLAALEAGLELEPGTSPPVLHRIRGWPRRRPGPVDDPSAAPEQLQPIRAIIRLLGPITPAEVAGFFDGSVTDVKRLWPADAIAVQAAGRKAWVLAGDEPPEIGPDLVRLLGPFDLLLQSRDRSLLLPDKERRRALWPSLGRPGAVLVGTELVGTWRPRASGRRFGIEATFWRRPTKAERGSIDLEAERLAAHRGAEFAGVATG